MDDDAGGRRRSRWIGVVGVAFARLRTRAAHVAPGRSAAVVWAVALTIAILLIVTGVALALADQGTATRDDADVRIVPGDGGTLSSVDGVESSRLGSTNDRAAAIREEDGVDHASPVLVETIHVQSADGDRPQRVLAVGVVSGDDSATVATLPTDPLSSGDPHYADGAYDGPWTGEAVLSPTAADRLDVGTGDDLAVTSGGSEGASSFTVTAVEEPVGESPDADVPVVLVQLSELQVLAGADDDGLADRVVVWGDSGASTAAGESVYPDAAVGTTDGQGVAALFDDGLALATSVVALLVGVTICALFVATTAGMAIDEDRRTLAVLASLGFSLRSRLAIVAIETMATALYGALFGVVLGVTGIVALNVVAVGTVASSDVAHLHPLFVPYAVAVALASALLAVPYPLAIAARTNVLEEVGR